jgi:glycosyltransferase involved in cell wall biosynthesis
MAGGRLMDRTSTPVVSINIPCYRQLNLFRECLQSVLAQTFDDYEVNVIDDAGDEDYRRYVESLANPKIKYQKNETRLGAMANMFSAITAGTGKYTLAFHEDDLLAPDYLRGAVEILEARPKCGFVAAEVREFRNDSPPVAEHLDGPMAHDVFETRADFLRGIFKGVEPMFGSVVYRRAALDGSKADHARYGTVVDRPFLLSILDSWSAAVIREPVAWYRGHGESDDRHEGMSADNILELLKTYRESLPEKMHIRDEALFFPYSADWLMILYRLTPEQRKPSLPRFMFQAWRAGLYNPRWERRFGLSRLRGALRDARSHA